MTTPQWGNTDLTILRAAGWDVLHDMDERWVAVHATSGRIIFTWIDVEEQIEWHNLPADSMEAFELCQRAAAYHFSCHLQERHDHEKWLYQLGQEDES